MSDAVSRLAPYYFQVAYVVREIEAAENWFKQVMGVPTFTRMSNISHGEGVEFRGRQACNTMHLSLAYMKDTQLELIEHVSGDSIYAEHLEKKGPGLHHVAFLVPDFEATVSELQQSDLELVVKGSAGPGSDFAYFDCEGPGYSTIEILGFDEATRGFMEALRQQSADALA